MNRTQRNRGATFAVLIVLALALALPAWAPASAASPVPGNPPEVWAYGNTVSLNQTTNWVNMYGSGEILVHAFYGWVVILTQTNTSTSNFTLEGQRAVVAKLFVDYCSPTCANPTGALVNLTVVAWQRDTAFANFTENGTVNVLAPPAEAGTQAALAIQNAQVYRQGNLTETASWTLHGVHRGSAYITTNVAADAAVTFTPSLGLVPRNVSSGESWNSSAAYQPTGEVTGRYDYNIQSPQASASGEGPINASFESQGTASLYGTDVGSTGLHGDGLHYTADEISTQLFVTGLVGFHFDDGFFLAPDGSGVFSHVGSLIRGGIFFGLETAGTQYLDISSGRGLGHVGIVAAQSRYSTSSTDGLTTAVGGVSPAATSGNSTNVQGQPMPTSQAESDYTSLFGSVGSGTHGLGGTLVLLLAVGIVGVLAAVLAVAMVERRRRGVSPPVAVAPSPVIPPGTGRTPSTPPPAGSPGSTSEDPLGNLW